MIDIDELDKRIILNDAWIAGTPYYTTIIANENTFKVLAIALNKKELNEYKGHKIKIDNNLKDNEYIIGTNKKGESE
ncbi:MAG: hypothetical protein ACI4PE_02800 [Bacilli bacterium]